MEKWASLSSDTKRDKNVNKGQKCKTPGNCNCPCNKGQLASFLAHNQQNSHHKNTFPFSILSFRAYQFHIHIPLSASESSVHEGRAGAGSGASWTTSGSAATLAGTGGLAFFFRSLIASCSVLICCHCQPRYPAKRVCIQTVHYSSLRNGSKPNSPPTAKTSCSCQERNCQNKRRHKA